MPYLAIEEHIDPSLMRPKLAWTIEDEEEDEKSKQAYHQYDDLWNLDDRNKTEERPNMHKKEENSHLNQKKIYSYLLNNIAGS